MLGCCVHRPARRCDAIVPAIANAHALVLGSRSRPEKKEKGHFFISLLGKNEQSTNRRNEERQNNLLCIVANLSIYSVSFLD